MGDALGCLLIGDGIAGWLEPLETLLRARGTRTVRIGGEGLLDAAQEGLRQARGTGGVCIAAEGEMWAAALALAAQLPVERIVLIAPEDRAISMRDERSRRLQRLKSYTRRNLFFCISSILLLETDAETQPDRRVDELCRRLCNASVQRASLAYSASGYACAAARFLCGEKI